MVELGKYFGTENKLELTTTIAIKNIIAINEVQSTVTMKLKISVQWKDVELKYLDLKNNTAMNTVMASNVEKIWTPVLLFTNTKISQLVTFKNESATVEIEIIDGKAIYLFQVSIVYKIDSSFVGSIHQMNPSRKVLNGIWYHGKDW